MRISFTVEFGYKTARDKSSPTLGCVFFSVGVELRIAWTTSETRFFVFVPGFVSFSVVVFLCVCVCEKLTKWFLESDLFVNIIDREQFHREKNERFAP